MVKEFTSKQFPGIRLVKYSDGTASGHTGKLSVWVEPLKTAGGFRVRLKHHLSGLVIERKANKASVALKNVRAAAEELLEDLLAAFTDAEDGDYIVRQATRE